MLCYCLWAIGVRTFYFSEDPNFTFESTELVDEIWTLGTFYNIYFENNW